MARAADYKVELNGLEATPSLTAPIRQSMLLETLADRPPPSLAGLSRRMETDRRNIADLLQAKGYFAAIVTGQVDGDQIPWLVRLTIAPGPQFPIETLAATGPDGAPLPIDTSRQALDVPADAPAEGKLILDIQSRLLAHLAEAGHPLARLVDRHIVADHKSFTAAVTFTIDPGPACRFGPVAIAGIEGVDEDIIRKKLLFSTGMEYKESLVRRSREAVAALGVFQSVAITLAEAPDEEGLLPLTLEVREREQHSVGLGLGYSTSEGLGARVSWEDRNFLGAAERLELVGTLAEQQQGVEAHYRQPGFFLGPAFALLGDGELAHETREAYQRDALELGARIEWRLREALTLTGGVALSESFISQNGMRDDFSLIGLPVTLAYDAADNLLDPTRGWRADLAVTPWFNLLDTGDGFTRIEGTLKGYVPIIEDRLVGAAWVGAGTILGADRQQLPADKRFYAGGGSSVRGFAYQLAGPLDPQNDPLGGESLLSGGVETRIRVTESIGIVPFLDAGTVFTGEVPDLRGIFYGAGLGVRYHTGIGPVRLDVAIPLNRRNGIDDAFQLYIGFGQAF